MISSILRMHRRICVLLLAHLSFGNGVWAAEKIVLMTSINAPDSMIQEMQAKFVERFSKSRFDLQIVPRADQQDLEKTLTSADVKAVYWLSHSAKENSLTAGVSASSTIVDVHGNNVKHLFTTINPNIKMVAVIGCEARSVLEEFVNEGHYGRSSGLRFFATNNKVEALAALEAALKQTETYVSRLAPFESSAGRQTDWRRNDPLFVLSFRRAGRAEDALARVRIELGKKVLAILPETSGDSQQVLKIPIFREDLIGSSNLNIRIYKDLRDEDRSSSIGIISVADLNGSYSWNEFSNKDGTPLGQFQRLFVSSSINGIPFASQKRARGTLWPPNAED